MVDFPTPPFTLEMTMFTTYPTLQRETGAALTCAGNVLAEAVRAQLRPTVEACDDRDFETFSENTEG